MGEEALDLAAVEDGGEALRALCAGDVVQGQLLTPEDQPVEKHQGVEGLVLGCGGNLAVDGEVIVEGDDLRLAHLPGVALAVEEDVAFGPFEIGLLGSDTVMLAPDEIAHLAEQLGAADDSVRIHRDVAIAPWSLRRVHAECPFLEFLNGIRMLAPCFRGDKPVRNRQAQCQISHGCTEGALQDFIHG